MGVERDVAYVWAYRAAAEREARVRFTRLSERLGEIQASSEVIDLAARASEDEVRHERICSEIAVCFGGPPVAQERAEVPEVAPARFSLADRVLYEVVGFSCIVETLNASLMTATLEVARDPRIRSVVREILRDEVGHSRFGWAHLAWSRARGEGAFLSGALPRMLEGAAKEELFLPDEADPGGRLVELGNLPRSQRLAVFRESLESVLFPGFEALGVATTPARTWLADLLRQSTSEPKSPITAPRSGPSA
jgi:hypothetical protein